MYHIVNQVKNQKSYAHPSARVMSIKQCVSKIRKYQINQ